MPPENINDLNSLLQESYPELSKKMKLIAFYIIDQPQNLAINTLSSYCIRDWRLSFNFSSFC